MKHDSNLRASKDDVEFEISNLIRCVTHFIKQGDAFNVGLWAFQLAHCGNTLLPGGYYSDEG